MRLWFRLAATLGMSVARCQREVSAAEFTQWAAYHVLEPFGPGVDDQRGAFLAWLLNTLLGKRRVSMDQFQLGERQARRAQTGEELHNVLVAMTAAFKAREAQRDRRR